MSLPPTIISFPPHRCSRARFSPSHLTKVVISAREDVLACECEFSAVHNTLSHAAKVRYGGSRWEKLRAGRGCGARYFLLLKRAHFFFVSSLLLLFLF